MSKASSYLPSGFHTLTVHLTVNGAAQYIEFLQQAFDAVELTRSPTADGRLLNASVRIGNSVFMLNDVFPEFGGEAYAPVGRSDSLSIYLMPMQRALRRSRLVAKSHCQYGTNSGVTVMARLRILSASSGQSPHTSKT
jgi:uncharacterized glyoxalase superfamily protein PhnB